jgi:hypothetical protein
VVTNGTSPAGRPVQRRRSRDLEDPEHIAAAQLLALLVHHPARPLPSGKRAGRNDHPDSLADGGVRREFVEGFGQVAEIDDLVERLDVAAQVAVHEA